MDLLIKNIGTLYTPSEQQSYGQITTMRNVSVLCRDGLIKRIIPGDEALPGEGDIRTIVDARGMTLLPGFVDAHTHPVFWNTREKEFIMRLEGRSYEEIAAAGGGIRNSARDFRSTGKDAIRQITRRRLDTFTVYGTTTIEAKSGYGLSTNDEIKALEIIRELNTESCPEMVPTFLGAHEIPDEYRDNRNGYIDLIINEMIPLVADRKLAKYCDVFCEKGVFTVDESKRILDAAGRYGLKARIHADELSAFGGAELAAEIGAASADHLVMISDKAIEAMARQQVIPVLLPVTTFFLRKDRYAPARRLIEAGCEVAVATDFNPGSSMTQNMQLVWSVAALKLQMLPGELLWASTLIPAKSLGISDRIGSLQSGKQADMVLLDIPNLDYLPYHIGINHVKMTIKRGRVIYQNFTGETL
jgi:imidazolonepropionase